MATNQEIDRNEEAFSLLRAELSRSLTLLQQYHFDHLSRLTDYAAHTMRIPTKSPGYNRIMAPGFPD